MNMQYPFFPSPQIPRAIPGQMPQMMTSNIEEELLKIRQEIFNLNERLKRLETKQKQNYMQKDDNLHMM